MSSSYDTGAGSPLTLGPFSLIPDVGAGDPASYDDFAGSPLLSRGAGDPITLDDVGDSLIITVTPPIWGDHWGKDQDDPKPPGIITPGKGQSRTPFLRVPDADLYTWEGGFLIYLLMPGGKGSPLPFTNPPYRVDMVDVLGQVHPILEPGCYSAVQGQRSYCYPEPDQRTLVFTLPPLPQGVYKIKLTNAMLVTKLLGSSVRIIMDLDLLEVDAVRHGMPNTVFPGAYPNKRYPSE